jgi:predicted alpha/beta hydrolase family esterase
LSSFAEGPHHWITRWTAMEEWAKEVKVLFFHKEQLAVWIQDLLHQCEPVYIMHNRTWKKTGH